MANYLGLSRYDLITENPIDEYLKRVTIELILNRVIGCSDLDYGMLPLYQATSIFRLWMYDLVPRMILGHVPGLGAPMSDTVAPTGCDEIFIGNSGGIRDTIYKGNITVNDVYTIAPFLDNYYIFRNVSRNHTQMLINLLDQGMSLITC